MSVHKVPQDVEADDKFIGPLSFKQFLFGGGAIISGFLIYYCVSIGVWPVSAIFLPPFIVCAFLAFPWSREQTTEVWLAARIRFIIKSRKRLWDQTGVKQLVTVTAPVAPVHLYTDGLNQSEVRTRLSALASIVDSRGWAIKTPGIPLQQPDTPSDRLMAGTTRETTVLETIAATTTDLYDEDSSPIARQFETMIHTSEQIHRDQTKQLMDNVRTGKEPEIIHRTGYIQTDPISNQMAATIPAPVPRQGEQYWLGAQQQPQQPTNASTPPVPPPIPEPKVSTTQTPAAAPPQMSPATSALPPQPLFTPQTPVYQPSPLTQQLQQKPTIQTNPTLPSDDPVILELANTNHLDVATLSRQVNRKKPPEDEVVISLR